MTRDKNDGSNAGNYNRIQRKKCEMSDMANEISTARNR